jgi:hypothetical protein
MKFAYNRGKEDAKSSPPSPLRRLGATKTLEGFASGGRGIGEKWPWAVREWLERATSGGPVAGHLGCRPTYTPTT